jgi:hypothetical protein
MKDFCGCFVKQLYEKKEKRKKNHQKKKKKNLEKHVT